MAEEADSPADQRATIPPIPRFTRTEVGVWVVYGLLAVALVALPLAFGHFSLLNVGAIALLLAAAAMSLYWLHNGRLRTEEWLSPDDYQRYLDDLHRPYERKPPPD